MPLRIGLLTTVVAQVCNMLYGLILPRMLVLGYGSEVNGLVAGALQIVSLVALLEAGLSAASIRQLYAPLGRQDTAAVGALLGSVRRYYLRVAVSVAATGLVAGLVYALIVNSAESFMAIALISWVVIAGPVLDFALNSKFFVFFVACQRVFKFQTAQVASTVFKIIAVLVCARSGASVLTMLVVLSLGPLLKWLLLAALFRLEPFRFESSHPLVRIEQRGSVFGHQFLGAIVYSGPILYIATFIDAASASIFSVNNMIFGLSYTFLSMIMGQVVISRLGHLHVGGRVSDAGALLDKVARLAVVGAFVVMAASFILLSSFLGLYLGEGGGEYFSPVAALIFAVWGFVNVAKLPFQTMVNAAGRFRETLWISSVEMIVFLGVLFAGIQEPSNVLVLLALLISCSVKCVLLWLFVHRRILRQSCEIIFTFLFGLTALLAVCLAGGSFVTASAPLEWVLKSFVVVASLVSAGGVLVLASQGVGRLLRRGATSDGA